MQRNGKESACQLQVLNFLFQLYELCTSSLITGFGKLRIACGAGRKRVVPSKHFKKKQKGQFAS